MSKIEIEAIRKLPEEYVNDDTYICLGWVKAGADEPFVVASNPNLQPLLFENGDWRELKGEISPPAIQSDTAH